MRRTRTWGGEPANTRGARGARLGRPARRDPPLGGDPPRASTSSAKTQLRWFIPAVAVSIATVPVMALRWRLLLSAKRIDVPLAWLTRTYFVALFAGQFLPAAIGGDAVRAVELGRRTHDAPEAVASVLIDRLVGLVSLVVLAVAAVAIGGGSARRPGVIAAEAAFGVAAAGTLALLFSSRLRGVVARALEPRSDGHRLAAGGRFYDALHTYRGHTRTLALVGSARARRAGRPGRCDLAPGSRAQPRHPRFGRPLDRPGRLRLARPARLPERHRGARGRLRLLPARLRRPPAGGRARPGVLRRRARSRRSAARRCSSSGSSGTGWGR